MGGKIARFGIVGFWWGGVSLHVYVSCIVVELCGSQSRNIDTGLTLMHE